MGDVEKAEYKARARATLFYMMAAILPVSVWLGLGSEVKIDRMAVWLAMVALIALNLTPISRLRQGAGWARLLEDETTRDHRRSSFVFGFWGAIVAAAILVVIAAAHPLAGFDVARITISAGFCAALFSFATLELRAAR